MKESPILFTGEMVRALLREVDPKTETRRLDGLDEMNKDPGRVTFRGMEAYPDGTYRAVFDTLEGEPFSVKCKWGPPGSRLWVKETHARIAEGLLAHLDPDPEAYYTVYRANGEPAYWKDYGMDWIPSIFMKRIYSRVSLQIVSVRVERLWEITEDGARSEGVECVGCSSGEHEVCSYKAAYQVLWDKINGKQAPWEANPWVWVVDFKRV